MHGDSLCTDDVEHQRYREIVLSPEWQSAVLELPITERLQRALNMRMQSETGKAKKKFTTDGCQSADRRRCYAEA